MFQMLTNIIKNLFSKPATRRYPYSKREPFENARGHIDVDMSECTLCGMCQRKCPSNAIKVDREGKTWGVDPYKCIICNVCTETCPKKCIKSNACYTAPDYKLSVIERKKED